MRASADPRTGRARRCLPKRIAKVPCQCGPGLPGEASRRRPPGLGASGRRAHAGQARGLSGSRGSVVVAPSSAGTTHSSRSRSPMTERRPVRQEVRPSAARIAAAVDSTSPVPRGKRGSHHSELRLASPQRTGRTLGTAGGADQAHDRARPADTIRNRGSVRFGDRPVSPPMALGSGPVHRMVAAQPGWPCFSRYRWWYSSAG